MKLTISDILKSVVVSAILGLLTWIAVNTMKVPEIQSRYEDLKAQSERHDELFQQEIDKRVEIEKQLLILQTRLEK